MLFYLRIQADSYAQLVRYFYEPAKSKIVPGNFRGQIKDFAKLDVGYSSILAANCRWFDELTGDDGLRERSCSR